MKVSDQFLAAKKDKCLSAFLVISRTDSGTTTHRSYLRLCLDVRVKYSNDRETIFVECDAEISVTNYSPAENRKSNSNICFHMTNYGDRQMYSFLKAIKKDSDVRFEVIAYNNSNLLTENNMVSHKLIGKINDDEYLLDFYTGSDTINSPVK